MPLEQTITIINNSGKIISTGKELFSLFKEAKASYQEKKAQIETERGVPERAPPERGLQRAHTFDQLPNLPRRAEYGYYDHDHVYNRDHRPRAVNDDGYSEAGSHRSYRSRATHSRRHHDQTARPRAPLALTETNLKTLSEVSSVTPSRSASQAPPPAGYRSPYAETMPMDLAMSRMDLNRTEMRALAPIDRRRSFEVPRLYPESEYTVTTRAAEPKRRVKEIDMDLAYGNIPPDLADRHDLDPAFADSGGDNARSLIRKVEGLLNEAHCMQHSAGAMIKTLQEKPDSAAAVALTLADLSSAVAKVSPAVLTLLKGGSPAVFALLASPQFLVGTSIAVGVTAVMFGGWKIVKKVKEQQAAREAMAYEGVPLNRPAPLRTQTEVSAGYDEALVLEEELSTIETWRRGIPSYGENESADLELITPVAKRDLKGKDDFDVKSRRSVRTTKTSKTSKTHRSHKTRREDGTSRSEKKNGSAESDAGSVRSRRSTRRREVKAIEDGRSRRSEDGLELVPRIQRQSSNMLKSIFKKKEKETNHELVLA